jgi:von Willebrand factor type A domain
LSNLSKRRASAALALGVALAGAVACSAGKASTGSHSDPGLGTGGNGSGNSPGTGNGPGTAATGNIDTNPSNGGASPDGGCQHVEVNFVPKIPSIFVLVDRSGSMFDSMAWEPLKAGVLSVVQQLQGQVRFGFSAFSGQAAPGMCPIFAATAPALNNYDAISAAYAPLGKLDNPKGETPVGLALPLVEASLEGPGNDGDKYILFVTDGEPDFCDDGLSACPIDSTISHLQMLKAKGITTIVFGLKSTLSDISDATLQGFANAGAGQPVTVPFINKQPATAVQVCDSCGPVAGWVADWKTTGKTQDCRSAAATPATQTLGTYSAADGTAAVYRPNASDQAALAQQIASVVQGLKSCTFDLSEVSVNVDRLSEASVAIQGQTIPLSDTDGWRMNSPTQLALVGSACTTWNLPDNTKIDFNFPCDIIIPK